MTMTMTNWTCPDAEINMIKYVIKELSNDKYIVRYCYDEFTNDITHATMYDSIEEAQERINVYKEDLYCGYKYEIHEIEIKDKG